MKTKYFFVFICLTIFLSIGEKAFAQSRTHKRIFKNLCTRWELDSLQIRDTGEKFVVPDKIKGNYLRFYKNGTFESQDMGIRLNGKWKLNYDKMQIINFDIDNDRLPSEITFNIEECTKNSLVISSKPMSGGQTLMHYRLSSPKH